MAVTEIFNGTIPSPTETPWVEVPAASLYTVQIKGDATLQASLDTVGWFSISGTFQRNAAYGAQTANAYSLNDLPVKYVRLANYTGSTITANAKILDL